MHEADAQVDDTGDDAWDIAKCSQVDSVHIQACLHMHGVEVYPQPAGEEDI